MSEQQLSADIEQLQTKIAFQEDGIEQLSDALANQQNQLEKLQYQVQFLVNKIKNMQGSNIADATEEAPPPHY
ncbi:SlyX family protein [Alteromonadaceae bacterium BrNp21-10]|nr:SlyX family protein [Alteromonadaceae bacterium BrNp21-10]